MARVPGIMAAAWAQQRRSRDWRSSTAEARARTAERRAALWLCGELQAAGHDARLETFWCRPSWAFAHAWHVALGLAGSLVAVSHPSIGGAMILVAILAVIADALTGISPGRRLTPERASQNVVVDRGAADDERVRLIITANYDAGRVGLAYRDRVRAACARLREVTGGLSPGWLGWLVIGLMWLLAVAILRLEGTRGSHGRGRPAPPDRRAGDRAWRC